MGVIKAGTALPEWIFLWRGNILNLKGWFEWQESLKSTKTLIAMSMTLVASCLFDLTRLLYGWYWTGELSIWVTLQYVLSNIIISIVPNKHNRWSLITSYCQLETVATKLSVRPISGSKNFQNKTNISTFLWMKL